MVVDRSQESDLRKRAAWLLTMLAVVAVLLVVLLVFVLGGGSSDSSHPKPDGLITQTAPPSSPPATHGSAGPSSSHSSSTTGSSTPSTGAPNSGEPSIPSSSTCPSSATCALEGDPGQAIAAINAYRAQHNLPPVTGTVTAAAQKCALGNGNGCSGDYAESQVPGLSGTEAVAKLEGLKNSMLEPKLGSFAVGWALAPGSKQYYFAFVAGS